MIVASLAEGDRVQGWIVVSNEPLVGTDGEWTHHRLVLQDDAGNRRSTTLPRRRRYDREKGPRV